MSRSRSQLRVCSLYPDRLNIYGDRGNLMVLANRCARRGMGFSLVAADVGDPIDPRAHDLFYMGGGQDREQRVSGLDLVECKRDALRAAAAGGAVVLGVCGGYQLLGDFYEVDGERLPGAGLVAAHTVRPTGPRLIGPVSIEVEVDGAPRVLAGFENHGGRTYLDAGERPLGRVLHGHGSNGRDGCEGVRRGNVIGTYLHGPLLAKNAWFADWLIATALGAEDLPPLDDVWEEPAHRSGVGAAARAPAAGRAPTGDLDRRLFEEVWLQARLGDNLDSVYRFDEPPHAPRAFVPTSAEASLTYTKLAVARAAGRVSRAGKRGGGTAAPGRLLLRLVPDAIDRLGARLPHGSVLVSGTNGKTTTTRMLAAMLRASGRTVVHNHAGANTHWGIATALVDQAGQLGVFEADEAWLPLIATQLHPRLMVLGNLSRDRLDSYGEVERLSTLWGGLVSTHRGVHLVVNADDPRLVALARDRGAPGRISYFGIDDVSIGHAQPQHPRDALSCPNCGSDHSYERAFVGHLGHYACPECGAGRPRPDVAATTVRAEGMAGSGVSVRTPAGAFEIHVALPGLHNVYNALAALAAGVQLGVPPDALRAGLESMEVPFGRAETVRVAGKAVQVWLMKNPVGANAILETLGVERPRPGFDVWMALNDLHPDGRDVSWIWDVDFESFAGRVRRVTCTGRRAPELALRLEYAGWPLGPADVDEDLAPSFERALARAPQRLLALPTYTALLQLQAALEEHGAASREWAQSAPRLVAT